MAVVTLPGSSGGIVTVQSGSGDHIFVAQIIANTILLASVGGSSGTNLNTPVAVAVDGGTPTTAPPASTDGLQNILYLTGTGGGSFDVPTGYNYVVDLMTGPETITGSNVQVEGYDSAGSNYVLTGNVSIAAANVTGPQNVSVLGTANIATGDGNDTINLTGAGTVDGGAGANVIDVAATAGGAGIRVQSEGTGDTVSANGAFGGATTVISSGDGASITDTGDGAFNAMLLAAAATLTGGTGLTDVTTAGSDALVIAGSGPLTEIDTGTGDSIFAGTAVTANVSTEGSGAFVAGSIGAFTATDTGTNDTIAAFGASPANVTAGGSDAMVFGGSGTFNVSVGGSGNSVVAGSGSTLATLGGTGSYLYSETSATTVQATGTNDTIVGGGGPLAVTASSSAFGLFVYTNGSPLNFVGDNGPVTIVGSSGAESIAGGAGGTTLFGGTGSNITYTGSLGNLVFSAGAGNETLNASGSSTNNLLYAGQVSGATDILIGGTGNDTLVGGVGNDSLVGNTSSHDWFVFISGLGAAHPADTVTGFTSNSEVWLANYGAGAAAAATASASSGGGNTTITLSDGTTVTFTGVASATELQGHIISNNPAV